MNIKNSWKEFRIWLGWITSKPSDTLLLTVFVFSIFLMGIWDDPVPVIMIFLSILLVCTRNIGKPKNWRLVIKEAENFSSIYEKRISLNQITGLAKMVERTKIARDGQELYSCIEYLKKIFALEDKIKFSEKSLESTQKELRRLRIEYYKLNGGRFIAN